MQSRVAKSLHMISALIQSLREHWVRTHPFKKRGLICESQSYGIEAFAHFRRVVEELIDSLLNDIADLMSGDEKEKYLQALEQAK